MTDEQKKALLDFIDETLMPFFQMDAADCPECRREITMLQAIRRLVEEGPSVSRGFVQEWAIRSAYEVTHYADINTNFILRILREAGVKVEG